MRPREDPPIQSWSACPKCGAGMNSRNPCPNCSETHVPEEETKSIDNKEARRLVGFVDEHGTNLSKGEINFIANIIDTKQRAFSDKEKGKIQRIYQRRVVNGTPEDDDI